MTLEPETRKLLSDLLRNPAGEAGLPPALQMELLQKGAVVSLRQDGSQEAVQVLRDVCLMGQIDAAQSLALEALAQLAGENNPHALEALLLLALEHDFLPAQVLVSERGLQAPQPGRQAALELITGQVEKARKQDLRHLTAFVLDEADDRLAGRLLAAASKAGMTAWVTIVEAVRSPGTENAAKLLERYPALPPQERDLARHLLERAALAGDASAQEILSSLFIRYEDIHARDIAVKNAFAPRETVQRALFLFLAQQWQAYETLDFDHRLLVAAYETADMTMRKRLLDISRQSGQMDWFDRLSGPNRTRWLRDLSDADWETAINGLLSAGRSEELWRLGQLSSPLWSAHILTRLHDSGWQPEQAHEREAFGQLVQLARAAQTAPPSIRPRRSFHVPTMDDLRSLALSPDGKTLALGSSSNAIHLWRIDGRPEPLPVLYAASTQAHALAFSPDGEHLAAAVADHSIRVHQWEDGRAVKALQGHSGLVRSIAIAADGRSIYSASFDGTLRGWRFPIGSESRVLARSQGEFFAVALSPDSSLLIGAGADRALAVFQLPEGNKVRELEGHEATVTMLATAPQTQFVASAGRDQTIRVWNYVSGRAVQTIDYGSDPVTGLCIHPNEQIIFSAGYRGQLHVWDMSTGRALEELAHHKRAVIGLALTPGGETLVSASGDGSVTLWNLEIFLLARQPVEDMPLDRATTIQRQMEANNITPPEKNWLAFTLELLRWKQRFDIQLEGARTISVGEFDIQL